MFGIRDTQPIKIPVDWVHCRFCDRLLGREAYKVQDVDPLCEECAEREAQRVLTVKKAERSEKRRWREWIRALITRGDW
jgi:hypothetical protein